MSTAAAPSPPKPHRPVNLAPASRPVQIAAAAVLLGGLALTISSRPNLGLLFAASPIVQIHVYCAVTALVLGGAILVLRKGRTFHKTAGWVWVVLMATLAIASLFIREITPGRFSLIHLLSGWTLIALPLAIVFIRRGKIALHSRFMTFIWLGGLIIAGGFTFVPGRLMWAIFFGA